MLPSLACLARATPIARPAAQTFNLALPSARSTAPYPGLLRYTADLESTGTNPQQYPVVVIRHHIIPYNVLADFWNNLVVVGRLGDGPGLADGLLNAMITALNNYANNVHELDRVTVRDLLEGMANGSIRHDLNARPPEGLDTLAQIYEWLPGNLFIGPQNRSDDPGDMFETGAGWW